MSQVQKQKTKQSSKTDDVEAVAAKPADQTASDIIDSLIDEIDAVLEENAEEFVAAFVQKGGQ